MALAEKALRQIKTGENAPRTRVRLGSLDATPARGGSLLKSATAVYSVSSGTSEATCVSSLPLDEFVNADLDIRFGYGKQVVPYFTGKLVASDPDEYTVSYTGTAYGPYRNMSEQILGEQVDYRGFTLQDVVADVFRRAGTPRGRLVIIGGTRFLMQGEEAIFPFEATYTDVIAAAVESAGYIVCDMPDGRRVVMPTPRVGATARSKALYDPSSIPENGFKATSSVRNVYGRVAVFRYAEGGGYEFEPVIVPVKQSGRYKALPGKTYTVSDYLGSAEDAPQFAESLARLLEGGMFACDLSGVAVNPDIGPHDTFTVDNLEFRYRGGRNKERVLARYLVGADGTISASADTNGNRMTVSGSGLLVREKVLPKPHYVTSGKRSDYVFKLPEVAPLTGLVPSNTLVPSDTLTPKG